jgi:DNA/RNA-binding domain of Phe-tRNA-synthetase-like protein
VVAPHRGGGVMVTRGHGHGGEADAVDRELPGHVLECGDLGLAARRTRDEEGQHERAVKQRLRALANRYHGASVVTMRTQPLPHAYRAFFRQTGLDPDATRIPSEQVAVARLLQGGLRSGGLPADALLIALVETGVPVWALDADHVEPGGLGIRLSEAGEPFGAQGYPLAAGRLVVADSRVVHALLFGGLAPGHEVKRRTSRIVLFAVGVEGVPDIHLEEALWLCQDILTAG